MHYILYGYSYIQSTLIELYIISKLMELFLGRANIKKGFFIQHIFFVW